MLNLLLEQQIFNALLHYILFKPLIFKAFSVMLINGGLLHNCPEKYGTGKTNPRELYRKSTANKRQKQNIFSNLLKKLPFLYYICKN